MARRYGTAGSVSSLISSARSAYEREQAYQDQIAAYEWDLSAKTAEDHDKYVGYLTKRNKELETRDPAKALSVASKINSARSTFTSKEIQRASIAINYGQGTDSDKYNKMMGLYENAVNNGDYDLAQGLESQMATLQIKIMNAQQAAANAGAAAGKAAYAANKRGLDAEIKANKNILKELEAGFKDGSIDRTRYLTQKKTLLEEGNRIITAGLGIQPDGTISNPMGLKDTDIESYTGNIRDTQANNPNYFGKKGDLLSRGLSPFEVVRDPNSDEARLVDRQVGGYSWMGGAGDNPSTQGTIAAPEYVDKVDKAARAKEFKALGFGNGNMTDKGYEVTLPGQGGKAYLQIKDVNGQKIAIYKDPRDGSLKQFTPDGKSAMLISSERNGGSDYYSPLMGEQAAATQAELKNAGGLTGFGANIADNKLIQASPVGQFSSAAARISTGRGGIGDIANVATGGFGGSLLKIGGDTLNKISQITGLQKALNDKKVRDAAEAARVLQANRAEAQRQQASYQAQLAKSNVPAAPGKQLVYDWKTNTVQNKLSPVFKDPVPTNPDLRAQKAIRDALGRGSIYNNLR